MPASANWLTSFLNAYYKHRPINAMFIRVNDYDDRLANFSESCIADLCAEMESLLARLPVADGLGAAERIDGLRAANYLKNRLAEYRSRQFHLGNPSVCTGEAIFGIIALFIRDQAPRARRI
jgi:hypothetical protein